MPSLNGVWRAASRLVRRRRDVVRKCAAGERLQPPFKRSLLFEALEQRVLLSADLIPAADDAPALAPTAAPIVQSTAPQLLELDMAAALAQTASRPSVFADSTNWGYESLIDEPPARANGTELFLLDPGGSRAIDEDGPLATSTAQEPSQGQVFFLDLRGASNVDYDGPVAAKIDVPAFSAPEHRSSRPRGRHSRH